jgi:PKD repeat protein
MIPPGYANGSIITNTPPGTRLCRVRVTCSLPFNSGVSTGHSWSFSMATGYATKIFAYVGSTPFPLNTDVTVQSSHVFTGVYNVMIQNTSPLDSCLAAFTYVDSPVHQVHFIDHSSTTNGTVNSWNWVITNTNSGTTVFSSNNYQSPYVQLAANGSYNVCLTISSDSGCTATHCGNIFLQDTAAIYTQNPSYSCKLTNAAQVSCNAYEFDLILQRTGTTVFKLANFQFGINLAPGIIPAGGVISVSPVAGSSQISNVAQQPTPGKFTFDAVNNCIRITPMVPPGYANGSIITNTPQGTRLCRVRVTCSQPFNIGVNTGHAWSFSLATGYATKIFAYSGNTNTDVTNQASYSFTGAYNVVTSDFTTHQQLNSITPNQGYSGSVVTATIAGNFSNVTGVKLTKPTNPDIALPYFLNNGLNCGNEITSTFSLPNLTYGYYNLEVTTADTTMILPNAFRIDTIAAVVTSNCHAFFITQYDPVTDTLKLMDHSYNPDSNLLNVTSWNWTVHVGNSLYTFNTKNASIYLNGSNGNAYVCLTLYTSSATPCQSSYCDSVSLAPPPAYCNAYYYYQIDTVNHNVMFTDNSITNTGSFSSWAWTISHNGIQVFTSNLQNPVFNYAADGIYQVCLNTTTNYGCTAQRCISIYVPDSMIYNPCHLTVTSNINHVSVLNGNDGSIDLTVTGGTPPYTYAWNNGATTQDIYNLSSGMYYVVISTTPYCPSYAFSFNILQPFDSNSIYVDTLYSPVIDTCVNFVVDSFYIAGISIQGNYVTVHWVFVGGGVTATLNNTYSYSYYGSQVVILSVSCGAKNIANFTGYIYIDATTGVKENSVDPQIYLYPNPVSDFLNITFSEPNITYTSLKIYNTAGQQVFEQPIDMNIKQFGINVGELTKGVYFIRLNTDNNQTIVKKFLK